MKKKVWYPAFCAYGLLMLWLLFGQRMGRPNILPEGYWQEVRRHLNLIPFRTIVNMGRMLARGGSGVFHFAVVNLGGNVGMFIPLGLFLPAIWKRQRKFGAFVLTVAAVILTVELIQLLALLGSGDVDDLLLNVLGASIGFGCWKWIHRIRKSGEV